MMLILIEFYILICCLILAGKDATSFLLKEKKDDDFSATRIKRWHRDGVILYALYVLPCCKIDFPETWKIVLAAALIRLALFDLEFNRSASLDMHYLGSTAWIDRQFVKVFGLNGALKKSGVFFLLLVGANVWNNFVR